ncbi:MAG: HAMP domain-containing histidine kinase [Acidobacteria bacterium]|nr:HAMP domain-containing histidine kinase [Acidobacteriota bacterium]
MTKFRARLRRFEAPVDYGEIQQWLQQVRAAAASVILVATLFGIYIGVADIELSAAMAAVVVVHSLVRRRTPHSVTEVLVIDAVTISVGLGVSVQAHTPLVGAAAYLIAASVAFGGLKTLFWALSAFGASIALRPLLPAPGPTTLPFAGEMIGWIAVAVFLSAVALSFLAAATEVFKTKGVQAAALAAERKASQMKNEFVSMITHELRTPLTNISGFIDTLQESWRLLPPEEVDEFLKIVVSESEHLKNLVDDVLAIPRLQAGKLLMDPTDFALRAAAFKVVDRVFPEAGARSASVSIGSNVIVHADPHRVEQILRNLVENARKYGGDTVAVEAIPLGDKWQIVVSDNGTGLTNADGERVFGAFEQVTTGDSRTETGFGLGLTVARHLVDATGGRIWYEPGFPVGARFCFTLPAAKQQPSAGAVADVA